jgi:hypothetical protein
VTSLVRRSSWSLDQKKSPRSDFRGGGRIPFSTESDRRPAPGLKEADEYEPNNRKAGAAAVSDGKERIADEASLRHAMKHTPLAHGVKIVMFDLTLSK